MNQVKLNTNKLLSNTVIFAIGNFSSKFMIFLLIPLYTRCLSTSEYGMIDLITTTITLLLPVFTLTITEAVIRFTLDKENNSEDILSIGIKVVLLGFIPVIIGAPFLMKLLGTSEYIGYFIISYLLVAFKQIFSYYARGCEKVKAFVIISFLDSLLLFLLNVIFLLIFKKGINGYYYSYILTEIIIISIWILTLKIDYKEVFKSKNKLLAKKMLTYSIPMIPNSVSWWISNTSDKYILKLFAGASATGIYAAAYKVPSLLNTITGVFIQAWQITAVDEYGKKDKSGFTEVYNYYFGINSIICSILIIFQDYLEKFCFLIVIN
ncbi:oligosaccharide flippase family protein [Clostridium paraputrificum]|uniref:lipopolysaccharide biosynthesis protein n=1 Tax=Clostridium paraputrificum TaxID=29363 RepID=UPI00325B12BF